MAPRRRPLRPWLRHGGLARLWSALILLGAGLVPGLPALAQKASWRTLTQADGLANVAVTALAQDSDGYLWVGTEGGMFRYNGQQMRRFGPEDGLPSTLVNDLLAGPGGRLWVASARGLFVRATNGAPFQPVQAAPGASGVLATEHEQVLAPGPAGDAGVFVVSKRRLLQVRPANDGTGAAAIAVFSDAQIEQNPELKDVHGLLRGRDGTLRFGCGSGVCEWAGGALRRFGPADGLRAARWSRLAQDGQGAWWARTEQHVAQQPAGSPRFVDRSPGGPGPRVLNMPKAMLADRGGAIVIQVDDGLARWNGQRWALIGSHQGLSIGGGVQALLQDTNGHLWVGTAGHGLTQWRGYPSARVWPDPPGSDVWTFFQDRQGQTHLGTGNGLYTLGPDGALARRQGTIEQQIGAVAEDTGGRLWYGSFSGQLMRRTPGTRADTRVATLPLIFRLLLDRQGRLWAATQRGIYRAVHPERDEMPVLMPYDALATPRGAPQTFWACEAPDGALWFATAEGLLRHQDSAAGSAWTHVKPLNEATGRTEPLPAGMLACAPDGSLWAGNSDDSRLWQLKPTGDTSGDAWIAVDRTPALLADRRLQSLLLDRRGTLWLGTAQGVVFGRPGLWRSLRSADGLAWDDCNQLALYEEPGGTLWIGSSRGATRIEHPEHWPTPAPPSVVLARVELGDQPLRHPEGKVRLPWSTEPLTITLDAPDLREATGPRIGYQLDGLEERPHTTPGRELRYAGLAPGAYRLSFWAESAEGGPRSPARQLDIEIIPPWWRTVWAYALFGGLAGAVAVAGYRWRTLRFRQRQQALERLVRERTHELETSRDALRDLAMKDPLTGLWNRRAMMDMLHTEIERCRRAGLPLTVLLCDADHFKRVNDQYGHPAGDEVLCEISRRLQASVRSYDRVGRHGGEEFLIVLPDLDVAHPADRDRLDALRVALRAQPVAVDAATRLSITCSFGAHTARPHETCTALTLIEHADRALYRAKQAGRDRVDYGASE